MPYIIAVFCLLCAAATAATAQVYDQKTCSREYYTANKNAQHGSTYADVMGGLNHGLDVVDESLAPDNCPKYYVTVLQARLAQQAIQQPARTRNPLAYAPSSGPSSTIYVETPYVTAPQIQITPITAPAPITPVYRETFDANAHYNDVVRQSQASQAERQMSTIIANQPEPRYGIRGYGTP
jgi:hypothetical protein